MRRIVILSVIGLGWLWPAMTFALGLGEIQVRSYINEPFEARIPIREAEPRELDTLSARIASGERFRNAGIARPAVLEDLQFEVQTQGETPRLRLYSARAIREPFLNFLLDTRWREGRLIREYAVLLDPPPARSRTAEGETPRSAASNTAQPTRTPSRPQPESPSRYGPVQRNETLWEIAQATRPEPSVSVYSMMIALFRANPGAFVDSNINNLRSGVTLEVPDRAAIDRIGPATARREFTEQTDSWRSARRETAPEPAPATESTSQRAPDTGSPAITAGNATTTAERDQTAPQGSGEGRVEVLPADAEQLPDDLAGRLESLENKLQQTESDALRVESENEQLRLQLSTLQEKLSDLQSTMAGRQDAIAQLQQTVESLRSQGPSARPSDTQQAAAGAATGGINRLWWFGSAAGAVLILLGGIGWFLWRRRQASTETPGMSGGLPAAERMEPEAQDIPSTLPSSRESDAAAETKPEAATPPVREPAEETEAVEDEPPGERQEDPLVEADHLMNYGLAQHAVDLLTQAVETDPGHHAYRLKLLEALQTTGDRSAFEAQIRALQDQLGPQDDQIWERAATMGRAFIPDSPLFTEEAAAEDNQDLPPIEFEDEDLAELGIADEPNQPAADTGSAPGEMPDETQNLDLHDEGPSEALLEPAASHSEGPTDTFPELDFPETEPEEPHGRPTTDTPGTESNTEAAAFPELDADFLDDTTTPEPAKATEPPSESSTSEEAFDFDLDAAFAESAQEETSPAPASMQPETPSPTPGSESEDWLGGDDSFGAIDLDRDEAGNVETKIDLAQAFLEMQDAEGAKEILEEVLQEGNEAQRQRAQEMIGQIDPG